MTSEGALAVSQVFMAEAMRSGQVLGMATRTRAQAQARLAAAVITLPDAQCGSGRCPSPCIISQ